MLNYSKGVITLLLYWEVMTLKTRGSLMVERRAAQRSAGSSPAPEEFG